MVGWFTWGFYRGHDVWKPRANSVLTPEMIFRFDGLIDILFIGRLEMQHL